MVNERRRVAGAARVDAPSMVDLADTDFATTSDTGSSLPGTDLLSHKLANFPACRDGHGRKAAQPIDRRSQDDERLEFLFHRNQRPNMLVTSKHRVLDKCECQW